jgi:Helicase HerA, central domain
MAPMMIQRHAIRENTNRHPMLPARCPASLPVRRLSDLKEGNRVLTRGLCLGTNPDGQPLYLHPRHLKTHLHLIGPTGQGKSRLILWIFKLLCSTNRPIVLIDPKADLYRMARDWALLNGYQKRLVLFDLSGDVIPGYNPLRHNGLRIDLQTQWVRESIRSAWGNSTFETTPLLARMLYLCLYTARALSVSMMEALDVLRPSPTLRHAAIQRIGDPFVRGCLVAYDNLSDRLKAEQSNSTVSRLEMFLCDEIVRKVICSPQSIDLEQLLGERKIILVNFGKHQPLMPDAVKLLGRMFFNDLLAHLYKGHGEGKFNEDKPCYVICDEIQNFATKQVCDALDEGRGIGCHMTIAHQHLHQLADEDQSGYLLHSVMADARTKMCFGGMAPQDLQVLSEFLMMRHFDPWRIKHIQRNPIFAPVKTVVAVPTRSRSRAKSWSTTENESETDTVSHSVEHSTSRGRSLAASVAHTTGEQESYSFGRNSSTTESQNWDTSDTVSGAHTTAFAEAHGRSRGRSIGEGRTDSYGTHSASGWSQGEGQHSATSTGEGQSMSPPREHILYTDDPEVIGLSSHSGATEGQSSFAGTSGAVGSLVGHATNHMQSISDGEMDSTSRSSSDTEGWAHSVQEGYGVAHQTGESEAWMRGTNRSLTLGNTVTNSASETEGTSDSVGHATTFGSALTEGETDTEGESVTMSPFYEYIREEIETPVFLTPEEQRLLEMQKLYRAKMQHMVVIAPENPDILVRAPIVDDPFITKLQLAARLESIHADLQSYFTVDHHSSGTIGGEADSTDIVDVEVHDVHTPQSAVALPSPTPPENLTEAEWWDRWHVMGHGGKRRLEK